MVCKLLKVFYGLKQASRLGYERLSNFLLKKLDFQQINANHSMFMLSAGINGPIVSTFLNDIKIMEVKNSEVINQVTKELTVAFEMVDIGLINFYFGLKVNQNHQKKR